MTEMRSIVYHTLVVATGSRYRNNMPWKEAETTAQTLANVAKLRGEIEKARSIVVAGAGLTGVEFAAELGLAYGKSGRKKITLVGTEEDLPLTPQVKTSVRETARRQLAKLGVSYVGGVKATTRPAPPVAAAAGGDNSMNGGDKKMAVAQAQTVTLTKSNGETRTMTADLVVPAYGVIPNTFFVPDRLRNDTTGGHMRQLPDLRTPGYDNVFVLGDVGDLQPARAAHADAQVRHLIKQFTAYFAGRPMKPYVFDANRLQMALSLSRDYGTGQAGSWQIWGYLVWYLKSRHLGTDQAAAYARGKVGLGRPWPNNY